VVTAEAVHATSASVEASCRINLCMDGMIHSMHVSWRGPWMLATGQQSAVPNQAAGGLVVAACFVIHAVTIGQMTSTAKKQQASVETGGGLVWRPRWPMVWSKDE
jgi:hypothetical protein